MKKHWDSFSHRPFLIFLLLLFLLLLLGLLLELLLAFLGLFFGVGGVRGGVGGAVGGGVAVARRRRLLTSLLLSLSWKQRSSSVVDKAYLHPQSCS